MVGPRVYTLEDVNALVPDLELVFVELDGLRQGAHAGLLSLCTPSRDAAGKEDLERLERAFARLSTDQQEVIRLARFAGLVHEEVARRMGRTPSATRSLLSRALARLATLLEEPED